MNNNDQEINNKRKNNNHDFHRRMLSEEDEDDVLILSLNPYRPSRPQRIPTPVDTPPYTANAAFTTATQQPSSLIPSIPLYDLERKFADVGSFVAGNKITLRDRAPRAWTIPVLPTCKHCKQESSGKPIITEKKKAINWLFLLLGQMLGCCTLEQLKYFYKHTKNHRTGDKDRVLFLTYLELCKQLVPNGPFDRSNLGT